MDHYEQIELDSEAYTSIWLIQKLLSGCKADTVLDSAGISEIEYILQNPHIFVVRNRQSGDIFDDSKFLVRGNCKGRLIPASRKETLGVNMTRPFPIVFMLRVEGRHGECGLNLDDCVLLDKAKTFIRRKEDVVYIMKYNASEVTYDETDLHNVSEEIQQRIYGKNSRNRIFPNLFFMHDEQIHIRIGLCLHSSVLYHLTQIFRKIQRIIRTVQIDFTTLQQNQEPCIDSMKKRKSNTCFKTSSYTSFGTKKTVNDILKCLKRFTGGRIWSLFIMPSVVMDIIRTRLDRFRILSILSNPPCPRYLTRSKAKQFKCNGTSAKVRRKSKENVHQCKTGYIYVWTERKIRSIAKAVYKMSLKAISKYVDKLSDLCRNIQDEYTKRGDNVALHEWKIVTERMVDLNRKIKGFGYVDGRITINIRKDDENCKEEVSTYLQKYFDMTKYRVSIEYKNRKFIPFSNLEQGSRILVNREDAEKYGTLGMFFKDNKETYFFTTCAHVIGENAIAYSHTDNTRIGKDVYICDSGSSGDTQESHMDFSLIEVSPERSLTCTFGWQLYRRSYFSWGLVGNTTSHCLQMGCY